MLWINPPFEHFARVIRKIGPESARAIVIAPEWTHLRWHKALQGITLTRVLIPKGKALFQNDEGKASTVGVPASSEAMMPFRTESTTQ